MRCLRIFFLLMMFTAWKTFAQSPIPAEGPPPPEKGIGRYFLAFEIKYPLDTCIHKTSFSLYGIDLDWVLNGVDNPGSAEILNTDVASFSSSKHDTIIIHKRGTFSVVLHHVHPTFFNAAHSGFYLVDTLQEIYHLRVGPPHQVKAKITTDIALNISNCSGDPYTFHSNVQRDSIDDNTIYAWTLNGSAVGKGDSTLILNSVKTNDVITCTVTNPGPCLNESSTDSYTVTAPLPALTITASDSTACEGDPVIFTAELENGGITPKLQWQINGANTGDGHSIFSTNALRDGDAVSCVATISACVPPVKSNTMTITISPRPIISLSRELTVKYGSSAQLIPVVTGNIASYSWSPATYISSTAIANPVVTPFTTTTYTLTVTSTSGCTAQASVKVTVPIFIPNTFTPNGDGVNDTWTIPQLALYPDCTVDVFNRNGTIIYQSKGYTEYWDGTTKGGILPAGTYYYLIDTKVNNKLSGSVTIIR